MARPDPAYLDVRRYTYVDEITTRYNDLDPQRHLNNVAIAIMFEDTRARFNKAMSISRPDQKPLALMASISIEYLSQGFYPAPIMSWAAVDTIGRSSWTIAQLLVQDDKPVAFARATQVYLEHGVAAPISENGRESLLKHNLRSA